MTPEQFEQFERHMKVLTWAALMILIVLIITLFKR